MCPQVELLFGLPFCRQTSEELWHTPAPLDPALMRKQQRQANLKLLQEGYALDELPANKYEDEEYVSQTDDGGGGSTARTSDSGGGMDDTAGSRRRPADATTVGTSQLPTGDPTAFTSTGTSASGATGVSGGGAGGSGGVEDDDDVAEFKIPG